MKYDAFISYNHAADGRLAPAIQKSLHKLAKPFYKFRALNVFRDETDLSATPYLWKSIENALSKSAYFILMASPKSAYSKWVKKEIDWWLTNRSIDTILICLTEGNIFWDNSTQDFDYLKSDAIASIFERKFVMEPLYVDFKGFRTSIDLSLGNPDFKKSIAVLAAAIHKKEPAYLIGEDIREYRKAIFLRNFFLITIFTLLIAVFFFAWNSRMNLAKSQKNLATSLIANAKLVLENDPALSFRLAEEAHHMDSENPDAFALAFACYLHPMKTIFEGNRDVDGFSKNGQYIVHISHHQDTINVINLNSGDQMHYFTGHYLGISLDNKFLASYFRDSVLLWDLQTGNRLHGFAWRYTETSLHSKFLKKPDCEKLRLWENPAFSSDANFLITYSTEKVVLWDLHTWNPVDSFEGQYKGSSSDGQFLAMRTGSKNLIWNLHTGKKMYRFSGEYVAFSNNSHFLITRLQGRISLWNVQTGKHSPPFSGEYLAVSPDNRLLATYFKGFISLWNLQTGRRSQFLPGEDLKFSPDNRFFATKIKDEIHVWDIQIGELAYRFRVKMKDDQIPQAQSLEVMDVLKEERTPFVFSFSPDGKFLLIESSYLEDWLFGLPSIDSKHVLREHKGEIYDIAFSNSKNWIVTASADHTARIWNIITGEIIDTLTHPDAVKSITLRGTQFYTDCADRLQYNWDINTFALTNTESSIYGMVTYSFPRNHFFDIIISSDQSAQLINSIVNDSIFTFQDRKGEITCAKISSGDKFIAIGSKDGTVIVYPFSPIAEIFNNVNKNLIIPKLDSTTAKKYGLESKNQKKKARNVEVIQVE